MGLERVNIVQVEPCLVSKRYTVLRKFISNSSVRDFFHLIDGEENHESGLKAVFVKLNKKAIGGPSPADSLLSTLHLRQ